MNKGITRISVVLIAIAVIFAGIAAYAWMRPATQVTETVTVEKNLVDLAKAEGQLTIYGSMDTPDFLNTIKPAFLSVYPWASVNFVGLDANDALSRVISEYKAGHVTADVLQSMGTTSHYMAAKEGALQEFQNPMLDLMNYPASFKDPKNVTETVYLMPVVLAYNTQLVTQQELPVNYTDLADPKWNGKLVFENPSSLSGAAVLFIHLYPIMGNSSWTTFMNAIKANNPIITEGSSDTFQKIAMGEAYIGFVSLNDYVASKDQGYPVGVTFLEPLVAEPVNIGIAKTAPHPHMAQLYVEWLSSVAGQAAFARTGRIPAHSQTAAATVLAGVLPPGVQMIVAGSNNPSFLENPEPWGTLFRDIFE